MDYELMHRNHPVASLSMTEEGLITGAKLVRIPERMPLGTMNGSVVNLGKLQSWWDGRRIPASRSGLRNLLDALDITETRQILLKSMGLSLSDQYWVRPSGSGLEWESVNYFDNEFSDDIGDLLFSKTRSMSPEFSFSSPDNTSDGVLKKRWKMIGGKRCLVKGGNGIIPQEPFNEVVASMVSEVLDLAHVDYAIVWDDGMPYSVCEDFIDKDIELITANRLLSACGKEGSTYRRLVSCCEEKNVDIVPFLDRMMTLDYLMCNGDRHTNNFGLIRDAETLEFIGPAPIYDTGTSMGAGMRTESIPKAAIECKPFKETFDQQMDYVTDLSWVDFDALRGSVPKVREVYESSEGLIDGPRIDAIMGLFIERIDRLERLSHIDRS